MATSVPGLAVGIASADCVPPLLACVDPGTDRRPAAVAAVHAGWRGLVAGVGEAGVAAVRAVGGGAADGATVAALAPPAGPCCSEVGPEVIAALRLRPGEVVAATRDGRGRIDLRTLVVTRLLRSGLAAGNIEVVGPCTICSRDWPSYGREGAAAGRILSFIEIR